MTVVEMRQKRGDLVQQMRALVATSEGRAMTDEESAQWDRLDLQQGRLAEQIGALDPDHAPRRSYVTDRAGLAAVEEELRQPLPTLAGGRQEDLGPPVGTRFARRPDDPAVLTLAQSLRSSVPVRVPSGIRSEDLSFGRAIRAIITGDWKHAEAESRVMATTPGASGGYVVPEAISLDVIDRARAQARVFQAGARTIPMETRELHFARVAQDPVPKWKIENQPAPVSDIVLERLTLRARTLIGIVKMSEELAQDSSPNAATVVEDAFAAALAGELDRAALRGDPSVPGEDQPRGVKFTPGIITLPAGGPLDYSVFSQAYQMIQANNGPSEGVSIIMSPRDAGALDRLIDGNNQPLQPPQSWGLMRQYVTTQVQTTLGAGTESEAYVAPWEHLYIGMRLPLQLTVSREAADAEGSAFRNYQIWIRAVLRADVLVSHENWFVLVTGIPAPTVARSASAPPPPPEPAPKTSAKKAA